MSMMLEAVPFPPTGDTLWARSDSDGRVFVAVRPICEAIGLDWHSQRQRIHRTPSLAEGEVMITAPSGGGMQRTLCLPLDLIPGWLFGADVNRVKPELKERLIAYQRECHRVLFEHFKGALHSAAAVAAVAEATPVEPAAEDEPSGLVGTERSLRLWLDIINQARMLQGPKAAIRLWGASPLPPLDGPPEERGPDAVTAFLESCTAAADPQARLPAEELWSAYLLWCGRTAADPVTQNAFGRVLRQRARWLKSNGRIVYLGIRLVAGG